MDIDAFYQEESDAWSGLGTRFDRLSPQAWETTGAAGEWTPKQLLAHIAGWHRHLAELLAVYSRGLDPRKPLSKEVIDERNAEFIGRFASWDAASVRVLSRDEHARAVVSIRSAAFRGFDESWEQIIRGNMTGHYDEHRPTLDAFLKERS